MAKRLAWFNDNGIPNDEQEESIAAYYGHLERARDLCRQGIAAALGKNDKDGAANRKADAALREVLFGNYAQALPASEHSNAT
jgi:hypothetical protein